MNTATTQITGADDNPPTLDRGVFLLAELSWGDDAYAEHVPTAALYRVTARTLANLDHVFGLIETGVLSPDGGFVAIPDGDVALLGCVAFTSDNALASVSGFYNHEHDQVIYLSGSNNMEIDAVKADFRPESEVFAPLPGEEFAYMSIRVQKEPDLDLTLCASGRSGPWKLNGYLERWTHLRGLILDGLAVPRS